MKFIISLVFGIASALVYGFFGQNVIPFAVCVMSTFLIPFLILFIRLNKRDQHKKWLDIVALSLLSMAVFIVSFSGINQLRGEFIGEYDVVVEDVYVKGGGAACFTTPQAEEGIVEFDDFRLIISDDDDVVEVGDTIKVRQYKGLFDKIYYVFVEEIG